MVKGVVYIHLAIIIQNINFKYNNMWESLGKLFGKFSTKWKIINILLIALLLVIGWFIAKKVFYVVLVIGIIVLIGMIINRFRK